MQENGIAHLAALRHCKPVAIALLCIVFTSLSRAADAPGVPSVKEAQALVDATMREFAQGLVDRSFATFHFKQCSKEFAAKTSPADLLKTFGPFITQQVDLTGLKGAPPEFDSAPAMENNALRLKGSYPTWPMRVMFDFDYVRDQDGWRVQAMTLSLKGTPESLKKAAMQENLPSNEKLEKLIKTTLLDLNQAIQKNDFTGIYGEASSVLKVQSSPSKLKEAFQTFVRNQTNIGGVGADDAKMFLDAPVKIEGKTLYAKGYFRTTPLFVLFDLEYIREGDEWKLLAVSINTVHPSDFNRDEEAKDRAKKDE